MSENNCCENGCCCCIRCEPCRRERRATHVHEFTGETELSLGNNAPSHAHRFSAVSDRAVAANGSHFHEITFRTDSEGHFHEFSGRSGFAIAVTSTRKGNRGDSRRFDNGRGFSNEFRDGRGNENCDRRDDEFLSDIDHVHYLESITTESANHRHGFQVATLIHDPMDLVIV